MISEVPLATNRKGTGKSTPLGLITGASAPRSSLGGTSTDHQNWVQQMLELHMLWCVPDLCGGVSDQEVELLVPEGSLMAASPAGGVIPAAAHHLGPQAQAAVGVALPGETPYPQAARLYQIHLWDQAQALQFSCLAC